MTGLRGALRWLAMILVFAAIGVGPGTLAASAQRAEPCAVVTVSPARPTSGQAVALSFRLVGPAATAASAGVGSSSSVVVRGSLSGPKLPTGPLAIQPSSGEPRSFRARFRAGAPGTWHARILVFPGESEGVGTPSPGAGNPLCYVSTRITVVRSTPTSAPDEGSGPLDVVLPILAGVPVILGVLLLLMSGRRRRRRASDAHTRAVRDREVPADQSTG